MIREFVIWYLNRICRAQHPDENYCSNCIHYDNEVEVCYLARTIDRLDYYR